MHLKFNPCCGKMLRSIGLIMVAVLIYFGIAYQIYRYVYDSVFRFGTMFQKPVACRGGLSTSVQGITLQNFQLCDGQGQPLLEIPELRVELGWWLAKVHTVHIRSPKTNFQYLSDGRWNWNFLLSNSTTKPSSTTSAATSTPFKILTHKEQLDQFIQALQPLLDRKASLVLESGEAHFAAPGLLTQPMAIQKIQLRLQRSTHLFPQEDQYELDMSLQSDFIPELILEGSYSKKNGLNISTKQPIDLPFSQCLPFLNPELPLVQMWQQSGIQGDMSITQFQVSGLTEQNPYLQLQCQLKAPLLQYRNLQVHNFSITFAWQPDCLYLQSLQWEFAHALFQLSGPSKIQLPSLQLTQPLSLNFQHLQLDKTLIFSIPGLEELWEFLQPEGQVSGKIFFQKSLKELPQAEAVCTNVKAVFEEVPYPVLVKYGHVSFADRCVTLHKVEAVSQSCDAKISVQGKAWPMEKPHPVAYDVQFNIQQLQLDKAVYDTFANEPNPKSWLKDIQSIWENLQPAGSISIQGSIQKARGNKDPPEFQVKVTPHHAQVCYIEFPYPVSNVQGTVQIQRGLVKFTDMQANKGKGKLTISGEIIAQSSKGLDVKMDVRGQEIPLDLDLAHALGAEYADIFKQFNPQGNFNISVQLEKKATSKQIQWQAKADLQNVSASYDEFPYRVNHIYGQVQLAPDNFVFQQLRGTKNQGTIQIQGFLRKKHLKLKLQAKRIPLDNELYSAVPKEAQQIWQDFSCLGYADGQIQIERRSSQEPLRWQADLGLSEMNGFYRPFKYSLTQGTGKIRLLPNFCQIYSFTARHQQAEIKISGKFEPNLLDLAIKGTNVPLDSELHHALPLEYQKIWNQFSPQGQVDMQCRFTRNGKQPLRTSMTIIPQGCQLCYQGFPYPVRQLVVNPQQPKGGIYIYDGNLTFDHLLSTWNQMQIEMNGSLQNIQNLAKPNLTQRTLEMQIKAQNLPVDQEFRYALETFFPDLMKSYVPEGSIQQCSLQLTNHFGTEDYFQYQIQLHQLNTQMQKESLVQKFAGDLQIRGYSYLGQNHVQGQIIQGAITMKNLTLEHWNSEFKYFQDYLLLHNMTGSFYNGELDGNLVLDTSDYGAYKGSIIIKEASLKSLEQALNENPQTQSPSTMSGFLNAEVSFQGNRYSTDTMTGKGRILLKDGEIWQMPIFLAMLDIFSLPSRPAFREGEVQFGIHSNQINITSLRLESSLISISGSGNISLDGEIALTLLTHFSTDLIPRIPFVDRVWSNISSDIFSLSVRGTLNKPTIGVEQWGKVKDLFEERNKKKPE